MSVSTGTKSISECYELGYLRVITDSGSWQVNIPPHTLYKVGGGSPWFCCKCGFETFNVSDVRKGEGCKDAEET